MIGGGGRDGFQKTEPPLSRVTQSGDHIRRAAWFGAVDEKANRSG